MPVPQEEYEQELTTEEECEEEENEEEIPSYRTSRAMTNDSKAMELRLHSLSTSFLRSFFSYVQAVFKINFFLILTGTWSGEHALGPCSYYS